MEKRYDVIVVGSGMGGLAAAACLAQKKYRVLVIEKHCRPGGYTHSFRRNGFVFDSAVRNVAGAQGEGLLNTLLRNLDLEGALPFIEVETVYRAIYPHHDITVQRGTEGFCQAYGEAFPHEKERLRSLLTEMQAIYRSTRHLLQVNNPMEVLSNPEMAQYNTMTFHDLLTKYLRDENLIYTLAALWGYFGASPRLSSAMYYAYAIMSFFVEGTYYLEGSFQNLSRALINKIREWGGEVRLNTEVTKICVQDKKVSGVLCASEEVFHAEAVLANSDLLKTINTLIGRESFSSRYLKKIDALTSGMSAFEVFIGTDLPLEKMALAHEVFIYTQYDYHTLYESHRRLAQLGQDGLAGLTITFPSLVDRSLAPEGQHTVILTTLVPWDIGCPWASQKPRYEQEMVRLAERALPRLSRHIIMMESATPVTMERYTGNSFGAAFGWEQNIRQTISRPQQVTPLAGLYLAGHWTHPGGGVVSAFLSGTKAAHKIMERTGKGVRRGGV